MKFSTKEMVLVGIFAALTAVLSPISLPIQPVPFTLQMFMVFFSAVVLGSKYGALSQLIYILLGAAGLPVFSGYTGGIQKLLGATGGYLISFPIVTFIVGKLLEKVQIKSKTLNMFYTLSVLLLGLGITYALGATQLAAVAHLSAKKAISLGILPFIPFDLVKLILAAVLGHSVRNALVKANLLRLNML